MVIDAEDDE